MTNYQITINSLSSVYLRKHQSWNCFQTSFDEKDGMKLWN